MNSLIVNDCPHSVEMLEPNGFISITNPESGKVRILNMFNCKQCGMNVAIEDKTELGETPVSEQ